MKRILIFGNSGSGKSTLAKTLCSSEGLTHLDLDNLAWLPTMPPERKAVEESSAEILEFIQLNSNWVIEGCYTDLLEIAVPFSTEMIYMNLSVEQCIENAKNRPWEPHKYASKEAQDSNLQMLIEWIKKYPLRADTFSSAAHNSLYDKYSGAKRMYTSNNQNGE